MNLLHLKYAVEIADTGSINRAAENLYVSQPNLSRAIKELEASLGVVLFERSAKGMTRTPEGETFVEYSRALLKQVDAVEDMFKDIGRSKKRFSISVPRASYIADAFASFSKELDSKDEVEIFYNETNSQRAIQNILQEDYKLGIVRYAEIYDSYYKNLLDEKGIAYELISEFSYMLLVNAQSPLADKTDLASEDLADYVEIAHADPYVPSLPLAAVKKEELSGNSHRRIFVFERASQLELLSQNPECYMWVSPVPESTLKRFNLVQRSCPGNDRIYKDVLIHRKDYRLSEMDKSFVARLVKAKRETLDKWFK